MAHRYRIIHTESDEIPDARDFRRNMEEIAAEVNGRIDRDNVQEQVVNTGMIKGAAFNSFREDSFYDGEADVTLTKDTLAWQRTGTGGNRIGRIEVDLTVASEVRAFWSAEWEWDYTEHGAGAGSSEMARNCARFSLQIDGVEVGRVHRRASTHHHYAGFTSGVLQLPAGPVVIEVLGRLWNEESDSSASYDLSVKTRELVMWGRRR